MRLDVLCINNAIVVRSYLNKEQIWRSSRSGPNFDWGYHLVIGGFLYRTRPCEQGLEWHYCKFILISSQQLDDGKISCNVRLYEVTTVKVGFAYMCWFLCYFIISLLKQTFAVQVTVCTLDNHGREKQQKVTFQCGQADSGHATGPDWAKLFFHNQWSSIDV